MILPTWWTWDIAFHVASGLLGAAGLVACLLVWRSGKLVDRVVLLLGLRDPDGRISNKKVLVTAVIFAGCIAFVSGVAKSVASSTDHDVGNNLVLLFGILLGGAGAHAGVQQKLGRGAPPSNGDGRGSGAFPAPPGPTP